jgi:creatinine amidohydrolase/Fe(II)-dependent formamide hydrolase-like protein
MKSLYFDVFKSLDKWGFKYVFLNNEHEERTHIEALKEIVIEVNSTMNIRAILQLNMDEAKGNEEICVSIQVPPMNHGIHADDAETGVMAAIFPNIVDTLMADTLIATDFDLRNKFNSPREAGEAWEANAREVTPLGYFGDPANYKKWNGDVYDRYLLIAQNASIAIINYLKKENYPWIENN